MRWSSSRDLDIPPLRPASDANSLLTEKDRFSFGTALPPREAISFCSLLSMDANPLGLLLFDIYHPLNGRLRI